MMITEKVYPEFEIKVRNNRSTLMTYIRKLHEEKYYLIPLVLHREHLVGTKLIDYREGFMDQFIMEAYKVILFYKVSGTMTDMYGNLVEVLDPNQESEFDRLGINLGRKL